jgi:hypothetical protein
MSLQITRTSQTEWKPLVEDGVKTEGVFVKVLRFDEATKRPPTFLLKFEAGASYPNHNHPGGEEVFILEGEVRFGPNQFQIQKRNDYSSYYNYDNCWFVFVSRAACPLKWLAVIGVSY